MTVPYYVGIQIGAYFATLVTFMIPMYGMGYMSVKDPSSGRDIDMYSVFFLAFQLMVIYHHCQVAVMTQNHTWLSTAAYLLSIALTPIIILLNNNTPSAIQYKSTFVGCLDQPSLWLSGILLFFVIMLPIYVFERTCGFIGWREKIIYKVRAKLS